MLEALYELLDLPGRGNWLRYDQWAPEAGVDPREADLAADWLIARGLAKRPAMGRLLEITPEGIDAVEESQREEPNDVGSGAVDVLTVAEHRQVEPALAEIQKFLDEHRDELDPEDAMDLDAQVQTIEAQMRSSRPRRSVIGAALAAVRWVGIAGVGGVVGNAAFNGAANLAHLLGF